MSDLEEIYKDVILSHNKRPRNSREMPDATGSGRGHNPLCGDQITVFIKVDADGTIQDVSFRAQACAICTASASLMTLDLKGKSIADAKSRLSRVVDMLKGPADADVPLEEWGDSAALAGVRKFPVRIKCATLPWHTFDAALAGGAPIATE